MRSDFRVRAAIRRVIPTIHRPYCEYDISILLINEKANGSHGDEQCDR